MLPDSEGLSGLLTLRAQLPDSRIAIVTSRANAETVRSAAELGAVGYVLKTTPFAQLTEDCRALMAGGTRFPTLSVERGAWDDHAGGDRLASLSAAQRRIFLALKSGGSNKQIAYDLGLAEATVKAHMTSIFRKLKVTNRSQAIVLARRLSGDV
jgi:DNA-binding NarL/FixJ family response regulator